MRIVLPTPLAAGKAPILFGFAQTAPQLACKLIHSSCQPGSALCLAAVQQQYACRPNMQSQVRRALACGAATKWAVQCNGVYWSSLCAWAHKGEERAEHLLPCPGRDKQMMSSSRRRLSALRSQLSAAFHPLVVLPSFRSFLPLPHSGHPTLPSDPSPRTPPPRHRVACQCGTSLVFEGEAQPIWERLAVPPFPAATLGGQRSGQVCGRGIAISVAGAGAGRAGVGYCALDPARDEGNAAASGAL